MESEDRKAKKHIVISDGAIFCGILAVVFVFIFGFHKNWFPTGEKEEVSPGAYVLEGTDSKICIVRNTNSTDSAFVIWV